MSLHGHAIARQVSARSATSLWTIYALPRYLSPRNRCLFSSWVPQEKVLDRDFASESIDRFHRWASRQNVEGIHMSYMDLARSLTKTNAHGMVQKESLVLAFDALITSAQDRDVRLMKVMFSDWIIRYGLGKDSQLHERIFHGLIARSAVNSAYKWLSVPPVHIVPTREQWHALIAACASQRNMLLAITSLKAMRRLGSPPTLATFDILFRTFFLCGFTPHIRILSTYLTSMKKEGLPYDSLLLLLLRDGYIRHGDSTLAKAAEKAYRDACTSNTLPIDGSSEHAASRESSLDLPSPEKSTSPKSSQQTDLSDTEKEKRLSLLVRKNGRRSAISAYEHYKKLGFRATQSTLTTILNETFDPTVLKFWENAFSLRAEAPPWAKLINNALLNGNATNAVVVYNAALAAGVRPTNAMLHPVLRALCAPGLRPPSDSAIDRALGTYREYIRLNEMDGAQEASETPATSSSNSHQPDAPIYNTLLRALASSENIKKYFPEAVSLVEEMKARGVTMDKMTSTSLVVLLIRSSSSFEEAYKSYELVCRPKEGISVLDEEGYIVVLNAFSKAIPNETSIPPPRLYFKIVKDMQEAGYRVSSKVYTILLHRLATLITRKPSSDEDAHRVSIAAAVRRVHHMLVVDASFDPDTSLWNQLMDTYQRAGCFQEAHQIWETLYHSNRFDHASISIIMDACGFAHAYTIAARIWRQVMDSTVRPNLSNWNSWIECLCRLGKLDEAVKVICMEMGRDASAGEETTVKPTVGSVQIVLSFAASATQKVEIGDRIKKYVPSLWRILPKEMQSRLSSP